MMSEATTASRPSGSADRMLAAGDAAEGHVGRYAAPADHDARVRFISIWSRMAAKWGIPRSMGEVHALLYIEGEPLNTDDVMASLDISRGNASMTLRRLVDWGIVHRVHARGDRRDYFIAEQDPWKMLRTIVRERKKREIDPLIESLHDCREAVESARHADAPDNPEHARIVAERRARIDRLVETIEMIDEVSSRFLGPGGDGLQQAAQLLVEPLLEPDQRQP